MTIGDRIAAAALGTALLAVGLGAWLVLVQPAAAPAQDVVDPFGATGEPSSATSSGTFVVDVEGAVREPGIIELPAGSRVADAIEAAGGYAPEADLVAAASQVNLAALVHDGQQITVPILGAAPTGSAPGIAAGGLVNLNAAGPDALDALPGIGPVTVQKIVAARAERPFGSLDELLTRKVLTKAQLDKIRDLVTIG